MPHIIFISIVVHKMNIVANEFKAFTFLAQVVFILSTAFRVSSVAAALITQYRRYV